tara:strand:- start:2614 stop:3567 length:954 start_codon:yes stop_codon:yes gene_type:complete
MKNKSISSPLVSIIMNCYNGEKYLKEAVDSVIAQTYKNWEIIFFDNASTDRSKEIINSYKNDKIKFFSSKINITLGKARNKAISKCSGLFIAFLDVDDLWLPKKLEKQIPLFENSKVGVVICDTFFFENDKNVKQLYKFKKPPTGNVFSDLLMNSFISLETVIIRKKCLKKLDHFFDERFSMIEEYDFFLRILLNWELNYVDEVLAKWRIHSSSWTWKKADLFPLEREMMIDKFKTNISDFSIEYFSEIKAMKIRGLINNFELLWSEKKGKLGRELIKKHVFYNNKVFILFIFSFFLPYRVYCFLKKKIESVILFYN